MKKNKVLIAIPSKKRADILEKNALKWLTQLTQVDWCVFIEREDMLEYGKIVAQEHLYIMETHNMGLGRTKQEIASYGSKMSYSHIFKIDDDVRGFTNLRKNVPVEEKGKHVENLIERLLQLLSTYRSIAVVSFPYRHELYKIDDEIVKTKRAQTAYLAKIEFFHADPQLSVFEDFAVGLNAIASGQNVVRYMHSGIEMGVEVGGGTGGHQSANRIERAKSEIPALQKIYPKLRFRKVDKPWGYEPDLRSIK